MKCLITGSKSGIGKAIANELLHHYELWCPEIRIENLSLDLLNDADLFINNAFSHEEPFRQSELIYEAYCIAPNHRQIVIGSMTSDYTKLKDKEPHMYSTGKLAVEAMSHQMFAKNKRCTLIKPGYVDTPSAQHVTNSKLDPTDVVNVVKFVLSMDAKMIVKEISFKR